MVSWEKALRTILVATLLALTVAHEAHAASDAFLKGAETYRRGGDKADLPAGFFIGYTLGVLHGVGVANATVVCLPMGVTNKQILDVVAKYVGEHPEQQRSEDAALTFYAVTEAWPCNN